MKLEDMQRRLRAAELDLTEGGLNAVNGVLRDLIDVVEALVHREARQVPLPLTQEPFARCPPAPPRRAVGDTPALVGVPFAVDGRFRANGRGMVLTGPFPFEDGTDPIGRLIDVAGTVWEVRGVERFAILREIRKGDPVGFVVRVARSSDQ